MRQRKKVYRRKIVGGFFGNIFTKSIENVPGIARKVATIALDEGKAFASTAGTALGQKVAEKIKGNSQRESSTALEIKRVISDIAPTAETEREMIATTKKIIITKRLKCST